MKIAVGTDDGLKISKSHFGMSKIFVIFKVINGEIIDLRQLENPVVAKHKHAEADDIVKILGDADIFIGRSMGRASVPRLIENSIIPYLTKLDSAREAVEKLIDGEMEYFYEWDNKEKKFKPAKK